MDLKQEFIYCGVCYKEFDEVETCNFYLTSCAHICCKLHILGTYNTGLYSTETTNNLEGGNACPVCHSNNISLVKIKEELPTELGNFLIPFPKQISLLASLGTFQYSALLKKLDYYKLENIRLLKKVKELKELLQAANDELRRAKDYQEEVSSLKHEVRDLKSQSHGRLIQKSFINHKKMIKTSPLVLFGTKETFLDKIRSQSLQKPMTPQKEAIHRDVSINEPSSKGQLSFFAESTKIDEILPKKLIQRKSLGLLNPNLLRTNRVAKVRTSTLQAAPYKKIPKLQPLFENRPFSLFDDSPLHTRRTPFFKK